MAYGNRIISNEITSAPRGLPFTVAELRDYMNQPFSEDDTLLEGIINAARQYVEDRCNISILTQEHTVVLSTDGDFGRVLPSQPLQSLDNVEYTNCDCMEFEAATTGTYSTMGSEFVQFKGQAGYWRLTYTAGYTTSTLPAGLKNVIKAVALSMFEQRGDNSWSLPAWVKEQMKQYSKKSWV